MIVLLQLCVQTVVEATRNSTPVVVLAGSGHWSDILAKLCEFDERNFEEAFLRDLLESKAWNFVF